MTDKKINNLVRSILNCLVPVFLAFLVGAVVILIIGENPLEAYSVLLKRSFFTSVGLQNTLHYAGPLILAGLAIAITFKANIYNMGVEGSLVLGGFFAGIVGANLTGLPSIPTKLICFLVAILCGVAFAMIAAVLKVKFRADEMVVTMMMNYALSKVLEYLATTVFRDTGAGYVCTPTVSEQAMFVRIFGKSRLTVFFFLVLVILAIMYIVMKKSKLGYEITAIGKNFEFAEATGMNVGKKIFLIMALSGALAGIAGAGWMLEDQYHYTLTFSSNPGLGWDGMLIALMGGHDPIGILIAAIFYAGLKTGADSINMYTSVPKEIVALIQGLIVLFLAVKFFNERFQLVHRFRKAKEA